MNLVVMTGGSRGIGYAALQRFTDHDWQGLNISRSPCDLAKVAQINIDLAQPGWQQQHHEQLCKHAAAASKICLIHNAAACWRDNISNVTPETLRTVLELNVVAPSILNQIFLPYMKPGSSIIYIGSTLSEKAVSQNASYITSKHAIAGLMKATCQDLAGTGIHTCCVCPGITDTEMLRERVNHDPKILDALRQIVTAKRLIEPQEIAEVIWFSANNSVMNGSILHAHLGQLEN